MVRFYAYGTVVVKTGTKTIPAKVINALTGEMTTVQLQLNHNGPVSVKSNHV